MTSFSPQHIFPSSSLSAPTSQIIHTSSLALTGPLPISSLLHIAINHLRTEGKGKSKETECNREAQVLILSPDRSGLREGLISENEGSLNGLRIDGELAGLLDRVEIK